MIIGEQKYGYSDIPPEISTPDTRLVIIENDPSILRHNNPATVGPILLHMANLEGLRIDDIPSNLHTSRNVQRELHAGLQYAKQLPHDQNQGIEPKEYHLPTGLTTISEKIIPVLDGLLHRGTQLAAKAGSADEQFKPFKRSIKVAGGRYDERTLSDFKNIAEKASPRLTNNDAFAQFGSYANQLSHETLWATATAVHVVYDILEAASPAWSRLEGTNQVFAYGKQLHNQLVEDKQVQEAAMNFAESQEFMVRMQQLSKVLAYAYTTKRHEILGNATTPTVVRMFESIPKTVEDYSRMFQYKANLGELFAFYENQRRQLQPTASIFGNKSAAPSPAPFYEPKPPRTSPDLEHTPTKVDVDYEEIRVEYEVLEGQLKELQAAYSPLSKKELKTTHGELWKTLSGIAQLSAELHITGLTQEDAARHINILSAIRDQLAVNQVRVEDDAAYEALLLEELGNLFRKSAAGKHQLPAHDKGFIDQSYSMIAQNWDEYRYLLTHTDSGFNAADIASLDRWFNKTLTLPEVAPETLAAEPAEQEVVEKLIIDLGGTAMSPFDGLLEQAAEQLTWEVLPAGDQEQIRRAITGAYDSDQVKNIDWQRIRNLVQLRDTFEGNMYRSKTGSLGMRPPYFVVELNLGEFTFAIAENALEGNATYLLREDLTAGTWQEVLELDKKTARSVGAHRIIHRSEKDHLVKILNSMQDLFTLQSA